MQTTEDYERATVERHEGAACGCATTASRTRLRRGKYVAEIVPESDGNRTIYHVVVQQVGSSRILGLSQELTFCAALEEGHECLRRLLRRKPKEPGRPLYDYSRAR
ncbi:MAG TPA: hypothetical protein VFT65_17325 [Candidatus Angelobacter sp.]|nr:hypothetical protein [Candidatus Angelobacter sp.]